jgi:hypothetical protein
MPNNSLGRLLVMDDSDMNSLLLRRCDEIIRLLTDSLDKSEYFTNLVI